MEFLNEKFVTTVLNKIMDDFYPTCLDSVAAPLKLTLGSEQQDDTKKFSKIC